MVYFFRSQDEHILAVQTQKEFVKETIDALTWLFSEAEMLDIKVIEGTFIGPRREMITPWSTAAVEITKNMKIEGIIRIEEFFPVKENHDNDDSIVYDKMLQRIYHKLDENIFTIDKKPEQIIHIEDFEKENSGWKTSYKYGVWVTFKEDATDTDMVLWLNRWFHKDKYGKFDMYDYQVELQHLKQVGRDSLFTFPKRGEME